MAVKHWFAKNVDGALVPTTEEGREWVNSLPYREIVAGQFSRPRNAKFHRKFFALLSLIHKNQEHYKTVDDLLLAFKYHVGHGHWITTRIASLAEYHLSEKRSPLTIEIFQPASISFAKMSEDEFSDFYSKALDFVVTVVIPGLDREDLERELMEFAE